MTEQVTIDFYCDERTQGLAREFAIMLVPYVAPGTKTEIVRGLAERLAKLAEKRYRDFREPTEPIRCHTCDDMTLPPNRVRVVVCARCSLVGRSVGSAG